MKAGKKPSLSVFWPPAVRPERTILGGNAPMSDEERRAERTKQVDAYLAQEKTRRADLFKQFVEECRHDPKYLERALKTLKPMRGRGFTKPPPWRDAAVGSIINALRGYPAKDICETIRISCLVSESTARRLYDEYRRASHKSGFVRKKKR